MDEGELRPAKPARKSNQHQSCVSESQQVLAPEINAATFKMIIDKTWMLTQLHHRLGDEIAGIAFNFLGEIGYFFLRRGKAHKHAITTRTIS